MPLRLLQVGMGGFGRSWASEVVPKVQGIELVGCVDVDPASLEQARAVTSLPAGRYFLSLDEALGSVEADAVLITTVLAAHVPAALAAINAGLHVLTEKPFAPTLQEAQRAVDAADQKDLILMVSQNYRFFPAVRAVQELVKQDDLGTLDAVYIDFRRYDHSLPPGQHRHYAVPQPILVDMAIHHFDLMRAVLGREPEEIFCRSWNPSWSNYTDPPEAVATVEFEGDVTVSYRGSWISHGPETPWAGEWRMNFSDAEVWWTSRGGTRTDPVKDDAVIVRRHGEEPRRLPLPHLRFVDRAGSLQAFLQAVETGQEPETSGHANLPTLALTIAAVEAAGQGMPLPLGGRLPT